MGASKLDRKRQALFTDTLQAEVSFSQVHILEIRTLSSGAWAQDMMVFSKTCPFVQPGFYGVELCGWLQI